MHTCTGAQSPVWGFFAHKRINRLAVLTLPPEMMVFFKTHIDWISDHAVDPDMRRYSTKNEAPRHYIDLDQYGSLPFDSLPRLRTDAAIKYSELFGITATGDTVGFFGPGYQWEDGPAGDSVKLAYRRFFTQQILPLYSNPEASLNIDSLLSFFRDNHLIHAGKSSFVSGFYRDYLSEHGILPWHLQKMQRDLTEAFRRRDAKRILRLCADMGHYIGDAHVPLHTTSNYNGQKTAQHGIHGFWESRIPELFADESYDYFVGKPEYIANTTDFFWKAVFDSNSMVDSVLEMERALHRSFPSDRQMCPDMRGGKPVLAPCRDYSAAYQDALQGMIERRMRAAILAVSCAWYTAWVDAGQPDLSALNLAPATEEEAKEEAEWKKMYGQGKILGRPEEH
ncbi:MAG: hypothetical protein IPJ82_21780 [Lewinellaceae bacterium]|nr:hypothetical protein [Lewinellaceae bacterium]